MSANIMDTDTDINTFTVDDAYNLMDLYFQQENIMYSSLINSYNYFIDYSVYNHLKYGENVFLEKVYKTFKITDRFKFDDIKIQPPTVESEGRLMFPSDARDRDLTYSLKVLASVSQYRDITNIISGDVKTIKVGKTEPEFQVAVIPVMIRSKYCNLTIQKNKLIDTDENEQINQEDYECNYDPGGYFIVKGAEKVVLSMERKVENKPLVFVKKDSGSEILSVEINSKSHGVNPNIQTIKISMTRDLMLAVNIFKEEVPVFIVMRALGLDTDKDLLNYTTYTDLDKDMFNHLRIYIESSKEHPIPNKLNSKILNKKDAIDWLITKIRYPKKYSSTESVSHKQIEMHLEDLLTNMFMPHMEKNLKNKAFYLGYMINRLMRVHTKRLDLDDRDSVINKRVDLPGVLLDELFRQYYKKMLNECSKYFKRRLNADTNTEITTEPPNIINLIKGSTIEQGLKSNLATGKFGQKNIVFAHNLQRLSYLQTMTYLRRIDSPTAKDSSIKLTGPRKVHGSANGYKCAIETPHGIKVGVVSALSMTANITVELPSQYVYLYKFLKDNILELNQVRYVDFLEQTKVFLNGNWLGISKDGYNLYKTIIQLRTNGDLDITVGITYNFRERELRVYADGGRMFRPLLKVKNNVIQINRKHLDNIYNISKHNITEKLKKIRTWNEFLIKNKGLIEYIDMEESYYMLFAQYPHIVERMRKRMLESKEMTKLDTSEATVANRYDDMMYLKYTHCEIHPMFIFGIITANIPFCNHNQATRDMFQYQQARNAVSIYATNYRHRIDTSSYILYTPNKPFVYTRGIKYVNTDKIPTGENCIVAIACYSGYNQEDSVIVNKSAADKGLFTLSYLKKYKSKIEKNQAVSKNDIFMRPDPNETTNMKYGDYSLLNNKGYVPEETVIKSNTAVLGKVSPIKPVGNNGKQFKDNSEIYKGNDIATVDLVKLGIIDNEGYEIRKVRLRIERIVAIGDKVCSRAGQKGTTGILLPHSDMPFTKHGITPDIIINPNGIPSRMTVGQLIECLTGKLGAIKGMVVDGTSFNNIDLDAVKEELEKEGYDGDGKEYLYNGITGENMATRIFIGPTYYQRQKQMALDKIHSRSIGPRTGLTRQPPDGRARDGGLRLGEMERDCLISHGGARFIKERMLDVADAYATYVCDNCGFFAQRIMTNSNKEVSYVTRTDTWECTSCSSDGNNNVKVSKIILPYACKLLFQELMAMNIAPRIRTDRANF